jgi:RluA family pseudouridine synthase
LRLDAALADWLPRSLGRPLPKSVLRKLIMAGAVQLEGRPSRVPGRVLRAGELIVAHVDEARLPPAASRADRGFVLLAAAILYEDEAIIAVDKPAGLPTVPTADPSRPCLVRAVEAFLAQAGRGPSTLGVHQRLDADTSGVVLFAKDPRANPALAAAFAEGAVEKSYDALTSRPARLPPSCWSVESALLPRGRAGMASVRVGGQPARTDFVLRAASARALLVQARPRTGRKHQIRVHLAEAGLPILGDPLYGPSTRGAPSRGPKDAASRARGPARPAGLPALRAGRLMLHARRLALRHPLTGASLVIESPWPPDFERLVLALGLSAAAKARPR